MPVRFLQLSYIFPTYSMCAPLRVVVRVLLHPPLHPQRFVCFSDFIFSDLYVFPISSSAIYMFLRFHPQRFMLFRFHLQRFICFYDFILSDLYVFPISSSDSTPGHRLQGYAASRWSLLSHLLGCPKLFCDNFARWGLKCPKTTLWVLPGTTLRTGVGND